MKPLTLFVGLAATLLAGVCFALEEPRPDAENVCNRTELVKKEKLVRKPIEYKITVDSMCGFLPCKKTVVESRMNTTREAHYVEVVKRVCCEGFAMTPERTCDPICLKACQFGKCVAPNQCECNPQPAANQPGYSGPQCNRFLCPAADRWGPNCDKECDCSDTAFCDARTGRCLCLPGWRGANCTEECDRQSGCDDLPLLPPLFVEPEVNIIKTDDNVAGRASALLLESSSAQETENDDKDKKAFSRITQLIDLFLIIIASALAFALFYYYRRFNKLKIELYYAAYPGSQPRGLDSSSGYSSVYSANDTIRDRPRMPLPGEPSYLSKNMNFDAATRNAVLEKDRPIDEHVFIAINSKTEKHLAMSKEPSQHNVYSDIELNLDSSFVGVRPLSKDQLTIPSENEYQVPKSPVCPTSNETNSHVNLYEELVPKTTANAEDNRQNQ